MKKCINFANSTFNLYVLYIKLAQNTKQCRRLDLENFITVIHFFFGRKGILWAKALGFWAAEHPPLCQQATSIQCAKTIVTHIQVDWLQSLKQFFINVSYHILVANLTLMALF